MTSQQDTGCGRNVYAVILAAGKGTRMKSARAKVLHEVFFRPMVHHVVEAVLPLQPEKILAVVGHQADRVRESLKKFSVECIEQREQKGTGHAVLTVEHAVPGHCDHVLILCGDTPLVRHATLQRLWQTHVQQAAAVTFLATNMEEPAGYGRVVTDNSGRVVAVVEEKDATDKQRQIRRVNGGIYCVRRDFLFDALSRVTADNSQSELYLTDIVEIAVGEGRQVACYDHPDSEEILGINSREQLARGHAILSHRRNRQLMDAGVTMLSPATTAVALEAEVGADTVLHAGVQILGRTVIGNGSQIGAYAVLDSCSVAPGMVVTPGTVAAGQKFSETS